MALGLAPGGTLLARGNFEIENRTSSGYENINCLKLRGNENLSFGGASDDESDYDSSLAHGRDLSSTNLLQGRVYGELKACKCD